MLSIIIFLVSLLLAHAALKLESRHAT